MLICFYSGDILNIMKMRTLTCAVTLPQTRENTLQFCFAHICDAGFIVVKNVFEQTCMPWEIPLPWGGAPSCLL